MNDQIPVESKTLRNSVQHNIGENIIGKVTQSMPQPTLQQHEYVSAYQTTYSTADGKEISYIQYAFDAMVECGPIFVSNILNAESLQRAVIKMKEDFAPIVVRYLLELANYFIDKHLKKLSEILKIFISSESVVWQFYKHCSTKYKHCTIQFLESRAKDILISVENYFRSLSTNLNYLYKKKCRHCKGYFCITPLTMST